MDLPTTVQNLITQSLENIRSDPNHHLTGAERYALYQSFGPSRLSRIAWIEEKKLDYGRFLENELKASSFADNVRGWLATLTARHVLPIWERDNRLNEYEETIIPQDILQISDDLATPENILHIAEEVLLNRFSVIEAFRLLCNDFNWPVELSAKYDAACAYRTAYEALEMILSDANFLEFLSKDTDRVEDIYKDFAATAEKAYSFSSNGSVESWFREQKPEFDAQKGLQFWEWWLTEAIPHAWELAMQSGEKSSKAIGSSNDGG